jgi:hypothetical protein
MSERKTIQINPDLFKVSNRKTQRKQPASQKIELKSELKTQKQKTLRKNVLKMIREKQQDAYKELFNTKKPTPIPPSTITTEFDKDFDESLKFFSSLANKVKSETPLNTTFKNHEPIVSTIQNSIPMSNFIPDPTQPPFQIIPQPQYGCLKNGSLPTFRSYTRKNGGELQPNIQSSSTIEQSIRDTPLLSNKKDFKEQIQKFDTIHQGNITPTEKQTQKQKIKYRKRKKIFKRTYRVGKSKTEPKIGVLVSNKTIRNRITTEAQLLKQTPINEVRKFLIKKGFIKIGTNSPNDVLRKMYETVSLVCGEIQNHNPENLLYNFIHDQE